MAQVGHNKRTWASYDAVLAGILGDGGFTSLLQIVLMILDELEVQNSHS